MFRIIRGRNMKCTDVIPWLSLFQLPTEISHTPIFSRLFSKLYDKSLFASLLFEPLPSHGGKLYGRDSKNSCSTEKLVPQLHNSPVFSKRCP